MDSTGKDHGLLKEANQLAATTDRSLRRTLCAGVYNRTITFVSISISVRGGAVLQRRVEAMTPRFLLIILVRTSPHLVSFGASQPCFKTRSRLLHHFIMVCDDPPRGLTIITYDTTLSTSSIPARTGLISGARNPIIQGDWSLGSESQRHVE